MAGTCDLLVAASCAYYPGYYWYSSLAPLLLPSSTWYKGISHELCLGVWAASHLLAQCSSLSLVLCSALRQEPSVLTGSAFPDFNMWDPHSAGTTSVSPQHARPLPYSL